MALVPLSILRLDTLKFNTELSMRNLSECALIVVLFNATVASTLPLVLELLNVPAGFLITPKYWLSVPSDLIPLNSSLKFPYT